MLTRREKAGIWFERLGLSRVLSLLPTRRKLLVLNYHRIGDWRKAVYDPGAYSATAEEFDEQLWYVKSRFHVATLAEAVDFIDSRRPWGGVGILITFDDGYLDNYRLAFPILKSNGLQGCFFLPTGFVGTTQVPWWDRIAYLVRHSSKRSIHLDYPQPVDIPLENSSRAGALDRLLSLYKSSEVTKPDMFLSQLQQACEVEEMAVERSFMNWDEARAMVDGGMAAGSHTHSHELLAKLSFEQQCEEARLSRQILERNLQVKVDTLAFPVGSRCSFSRITAKALQQSGYRAAFSFFGGVNLAGRTERYNVRRIAIEGYRPQGLFRAQTSLAAAGMDVIE